MTKALNVKIYLLLLIFFGVLLLPCIAAETGEKSRKYRLLLIDAQQGEPYKTFRQNLYQKLADLGYEEDRNLEISYYTMDNIASRAQMIWNFNEKYKKNNAICLSGTLVNIAFKEISTEFPDTEFVFGCVTDPVGIGLIDNFNTLPANNFTGVAYPVPVATRLRFIRKVMPDVKTIGLISSTMAQSLSYKQWLDAVLKLEEFKDLFIEYRTVPYIAGEGGIRRMTSVAKKYVRELDPKVDLFLAPNDQMGISESFQRMFDEIASKPLVGINVEGLMKGWGATMAISPSLEDQARLVAEMIHQVFRGKSVKGIMPQWPESHEVAFNLQKAKRFGMTIPDNLLHKAGSNIVK